MFLFSLFGWVILGLAISNTEGGTLSESLKALGSGKSKDVIIELEPVLGQVLQNPSLNALTGDSRRNEIISLLRQRSRATQLPVMNVLNSLGLGDKAKPFWIANRIAVKGVDSVALKALAAIPGNFVIRDAYKAKVYPVEEVEGDSNDEELALRDGKLQWGVEKINAEGVWKKGFTGKGVIVGIIDTGVNVNHVALQSNYKNDQYSWYDAFEQHKEPYDGNGHGTHCTGSICGNVNGVGVAPDAKWMACRGLDDEGSGNETTLLGCGQFMTCPSNPSGNTTENCTGYPQVVSNSWGGLIGAQSWYGEVIKAWGALNIIPVFALGNSGPGCMTAGSPGDQSNLISVGATDIKDKLARFSSRGPALGSISMKPEVSAPGADIWSCTHNKNDGYRKLSGTSMACPHVAGAVALLLSAKPTLDLNDTTSALENSAFQPKLSAIDTLTVCTPPKAPFSPPPYPNNGYGYGRIDALNALNAVLGKV